MELIERVKKYFGFNMGEIKALLISVFVYGLIISFSFDLPEVNVLLWLGYLLPSFLIAALAILVHIAVVRIDSLRVGYKAEYRLNYYVLAFAFIVSIISRGRIFIIVPGIIMFHMLEGLRVGKFRYGINWWEVRWPLFLGVIANLVLALFFRVLSNMGNFAGNPLVEKVILVNLSVAFFSMLPLPDFEGLYIYYSSALVYAFSFSLLLGACIAILLNLGFWISVFIPLIIGGIGWLAYLIGVEMK
ncbi:hypothetical protein KY345_00195 [Candidatus Woesearchaeota archaeon]|nr:hypothetical protein [Candidatus Woesearchaeota archaeon]